MAATLATTPAVVATAGSQPRIRSLDGLRGVGSLVVVVHHALLVIPAISAMYMALPGRALDSPRALSVEWWMYATPLRLVWAGPEAVLVFFVLSGIVLTAPLVAHERSGVEWLRYYVRRLCRLYVPVWGSLLVAALCCMIVPRQNLSGGTWLVGHPNPTLPQMMRDALLLLGTSSVNSPLWSLRWEVWFSLLLPMMFLVLRLVRVDRWPLLAVLVLALVSAIGHTPTIQVLVSSSTVAGSLEYLSVFSIGMIIALSGARVGQLRERVAQAGRGWRVGWLVVGLVFATSPTYVGTHPAARVSFGLHVATVVGVTMIVLSALVAPGVVRILESRLLHYAGIRSFSVYLVHEPILVSVAILVHARGFWPWVVIAPGAIALALLVAEGFYRVVERPATRLSRTLAVRGISKSGAC